VPRPIRFLLGDTPVEVAGEDPQLTVLEWLRTRMRRTGTKEGCAEGDCGACTVTVGTLDGERIRYRAYNSCIQLLATLDGKQLVTVEDLATGLPGAERRHPVQQAPSTSMDPVRFLHAGFVMSLFTLTTNLALGRRTRPQTTRTCTTRHDRALARQPVPLHRLRADRPRRMPSPGGGGARILRRLGTGDRGPAARCGRQTRSSSQPAAGAGSRRAAWRGYGTCWTKPRAAWSPAPPTWGG
jgi:aerobic-type carbon monoxide dehydrogenase small subunit (CoxS/CutS family)